MITPAAAETLTRGAMEAYVKECNCDTQEDVADALMRLVSMCGLGMCAVVGRDYAVLRLKGAAQYIETTQQSAQIAGGEKV